MTIAPEHPTLGELTGALRAERAHLETLAAESRERLSRQFDDLAGQLTPAPPATTSAPPVTPAPATPAPAPAPAGAKVEAQPDRRSLALSRRLLVVGLIALVFWGYQRWLTPWVGQNGQARLRSQGAPTLVAPEIGLDVAIGEGTGRGSLRRGPGHDTRSAGLDEAGNIVIAGHRSAYGGPFRRIHRLEKGDQVTLTAGEPVDFKVTSVKTGVAARDKGVRAQRGAHRLTLVTGSGSKRTVVVAEAAEHDEGEGVDGVEAAGGPLWAASTLSGLALVALWAGAAAALPRLTAWLRRRWGRAPTLLAIVPAGVVVATGLFDGLEGLLGRLY